MAGKFYVYRADLARYSDRRGAQPRRYRITFDRHHRRCGGSRYFFSKKDLLQVSLSHREPDRYILNVFRRGTEIERLRNM